MKQITQVINEKNNILEHVVQENEPVTLLYQYDAHVSSRITIKAHKNSVAQIYCIIINGNIESVIDIQLLGEGALVNVVGVYLLHDDQHINITTKQQHLVEGAQSSVIFKGVLTDSARVAYKGSIFVAKRARNSVAAQNNKTILLSKQAKAHSVPSLEVLSNDVHCAHGSAVGQLDAQQIMYAQSRGLNEKQAKKLLLQSFLQCGQPTIDAIIKKNMSRLS